MVWKVGKSVKSEKENGETCMLEGFDVVSASVGREKGGGPGSGVDVVGQLFPGAPFVKILCVLCVVVCILILRGGELVGQLLLRLSSPLCLLLLLEVGICLLHHLLVCCSLGGREMGNKRRESCCNCLQFCVCIA